MAFRLTDYVVRGELDNTQRGTVRATLWLTDTPEPVTLELAGDCWRDLAGCRCTFVNTEPQPGPHPKLAPHQTGEVGDMTASRKVRVPVGPVSDWYKKSKLGVPAEERHGNALYLEWFSDQNGRVVIESAEFAVEVSLPEWTMTSEEERRQIELNQEALARFLNRLEAALAPGKRVEVPETREMDEFEWERFLRKSDARTERFGEVLDKFKDDPDQDKQIDRHMGWDLSKRTWDIPDDLETDLPPEPEPPPETAGIDWVRDERGDICHPLYLRCRNLGVRMHHEVKKHGFGDGGTTNDDVDLMTFKVHCTGAKLAGGLNHVASDCPPERGFVVAYLKRALALLHEALAALDRVEQSGLLPELTPNYREELHALRVGILETMERYRAK